MIQDEEYKNQFKKILEIGKEANDFVKKYISDSLKDEFVLSMDDWYDYREMFYNKFNDSIYELRDYVVKKNLDLHEFEKEINPIKQDFYETDRHFEEVVTVLWRTTSEGDHAFILEQNKKIKSQVKEVKELNKKYKNIVKDFLTILSLFVALFSIVVTNVNIFEGKPSAYLVAVINLSLLIALSIIFMFVYRLFDFSKQKEEKNNELFKKLIKSLITLLILVLTIHETANIIKIIINNENNKNNSSSINSSQVSVPISGMSNYSVGLNFEITY